ncbi:MAG: trypsin-like peptidase domain-containing protein [Gammaproteobacteria bacterium]|nr:trypsin-like peptidase domain-containing protein [Gammaproteobacteria bacterium]
MEQLKRILQFMSWPVLCGVLIAVVVMQYQQMQQMNELQRLLKTASAPAPQTLPFSAAINRAAPSVVSINATPYTLESIEQISEDTVRLNFEEQTSLGSGVIVNDDGFIVTNYHVVSQLIFETDTVVTLQDGRSTPATLVAFDETNDLAILHINMDDLTPIPRGDDQNLNVGDVVFAIGYPRNIGQSVSQGIVSAMVNGQAEQTGNYLIQTDAAINPGNSGGALIDRNGNLVGINSSIFSETGRFEGIGFATPVTSAMQIMEELVSEAIANNPGYLGVLTGEVLNEETSRLFFGVPDIRGMLVENVDDGGPAKRAGILPGDVITQVDTSPVIDEETIILEFQNKRPGDRVVVQVYRDGQYLDLPTVLGFGQAMVFAP